MILEPWEWDGAEKTRACISAIKESLAKRGIETVEVWTTFVPGAVHVHYCSPPRNLLHAVYRGHT